MASTSSIASPRQHSKPNNANKPHIPPEHDCGVTDHWTACVGTDHSDLLFNHNNPARFPSAKGIAHHVHNEVPHRIQREYSVSSGDRRNPGRGDGETWNGDSFICPGQIDSDYSKVDPFINSRVMNRDEDECDYCDQEVTRPRAFKISLADVPIRVRKPKQRKARGYEVLPAIPRVSSFPPFELGEPPFYQDFETMSDFSWDAVTSDNLSVFSEEDWEDLESAYTHDTIDYELDRDLKLLRVARNDSGSSAPFPSMTPPYRTYAQALANKT